MNRLLRPASVAIVGASPNGLGASVLGNLERSGYRGQIYLVNPKRSEIAGRPCHPSVDALPDSIDCAVLAIPRAGVRQALEACARKGIGSAIVFSAGFAEAGEDGRAEQDWIARIAREHNITIQGPNCLGMVNYVDDIALTFVVTPPAKLQPGRQGIAIVSQSGAMAAVLIANFAARKAGVSYSISTGNEAASGVEDFVEHLFDDPHTRVITMIVEQFRAARRFLELAERALASGKHIVLLHPGSSGAARASAATHTGAMAGDYMVMRTKVRHAGVILVDTLEQLVDVSELLLRAPSLPSPSLPARGAAVLAESGAFKAMALDFCEKIGLELPVFSDAAAEALRSVLPDFIPPTNPMDLTAQALVDPGLYKRTLPIIFGDTRFGSLVLAIILTDETTSALKFPPIVEAIRELPADSRSKPILFAGMDEGARISQVFVDELRELNVPFFPSPERALHALGIITEWAASREELSLAPPTELTGLTLTPGVMPEYRSKDVLKQAGIPAPPGALAQTAIEAVAIAERIGYPVALKAQSANLSHKSDAGGVILNLADSEAVEAAWRRMREDIATALPGLRLDGILVEQMGRRGVELIVGARNDRDWGPILMVGLGGVLAEALQDVRLLAPDLSIDLIEREIHKLKASALLRGFRGSPAVDVRAAAEIVAKLGTMMLSAESIAEIDINPLIVYPAGQGALALDALIVVADL
jgi:acyl-CoA synthetase (NDP forming)